MLIFLAFYSQPNFPLKYNKFRIWRTGDVLSFIPANNLTIWNLVYLQSGASSRAKDGGAYFSAVYGSIEDPMAAPGPYKNLGPPFLGGSA